MQLIANALVAVVAIEHIYILVLEMFLWTTPRGLAAFSMTPQQAEATKTLAANQGLYNGFLAAGLIVSLLISIPDTAYAFKFFFLTCVVVAGIYGGLTVGIRIILIQSLPALLALILVWVAYR